MFHSELFSSSIASGANTFAQVSYVTADAILPTQNLGLTVINELPYLVHVMGVSANLVHVRAQANSMLPFPYIAISPNNRGTAFESPPRLLDLTMSPLPLRSTEEFDIFATQNAGAAQTPYIMVGFTDHLPTPLVLQLMPGGLVGNPLVPGRAFSVHWTASTTLTAGAFTLVTPIFDQTLPAGTYALIGSRAFSASCLFHRMFPATGPKWRPGGIGVQAYDALDPWFQRAWPVVGGKVIAPMGEWLRFYQNVPPKVEFFATAADSAEEGWFDLVYISPEMMQVI